MTTWEQEQKRVAEVGKIFDIDHRGAEMEILQDDGLHRHVKFTLPRTSMYRFSLVTWPGYLAITGDVESFTFSREPDMFEFFGGNRRRINPTYWAEKCVAGRDQLTTYSEELARQQVLEHFTDLVKSEGVPKGLGRAIREWILTDEEFGHEEGAHRLLKEFQHGNIYSCWCVARQDDGRRCGWQCKADDRAEAEREVKEHERVHPCMTSVMPVPAFRFTDTWEWDLTDWDHHYLYACHAITWGIGKYYARKRMPPRFWAKHRRL